jgi:hypothetical protein
MGLFTTSNKHRINTSINHNNQNYPRLVIRIGFQKEVPLYEELIE